MRAVHVCTKQTVERIFDLTDGPVVDVEVASKPRTIRVSRVVLRYTDERSLWDVRLPWDIHLSGHEVRDDGTAGPFLTSNWAPGNFLRNPAAYPWLDRLVHVYRPDGELDMGYDATDRDLEGDE